MSEAFYAHSPVKLPAKQAATKKVEKARPMRVFRALLHLGRQIMSGVASTSVAGSLTPMISNPEREKPAAEDGVTIAKASGFAYNSAGDFHDPAQFLDLVKKRHAHPGGKPDDPPSAVNETSKSPAAVGMLAEEAKLKRQANPRRHPGPGLSRQRPAVARAGA